ncbi:MAG: STAS domain-containing protein [Bacilli bacterium]
MKIDMEFIKGILFVRLSGKLNKKTVSSFNEDVIPVVLKHGLKNVVVNLDRLTNIDIEGIDALISLSSIVNKLNGKTSLCSLSARGVKKAISSSEASSRFYETSDELSAFSVFEI